MLLLLGALVTWLPRALAGAPQAEDTAQLDLFTSRPQSRVSPAFLSFTLDANLATDPRFLTFLGSPKLRTLARGLSPAYLRFGGTKSDFLIFDPQKEPTFEERSYWQSQTNQDVCKSWSFPFDVEERLRMEWPFQEQLLLREQYQKKFKNSTYSMKRPAAWPKQTLCLELSNLGSSTLEPWKPPPLSLPGRGQNWARET